MPASSAPGAVPSVPAAAVDQVVAHGGQRRAAEMSRICVAPVAVLPARGALSRGGLVLLPLVMVMVMAPAAVRQWRAAHDVPVAARRCRKGKERKGSTSGAERGAVVAGEMGMAYDANEPRLL